MMSTTSTIATTVLDALSAMPAMLTPRGVLVFVCVCLVGVSLSVASAGRRADRHGG